MTSHGEFLCCCRKRCRGPDSGDGRPERSRRQRYGGCPNNGSRSFTLTPQKNSELVQFDDMRALRICNKFSVPIPQSTPPGVAATEPATDRPIPIQTPSPVGLELSYGGQTTELGPGDCASMTAQELRVSPTQPLEGDAVLQGTVTSTAIVVPVRGERIGKVTTETVRATSGRYASNG